MKKVAALFVETTGISYGLPNVEPWDRERDARRYEGPYPVVAHPPCERWGRYWGGSPATFPRLIQGNDGGCFATALHAVRIFGGMPIRLRPTHTLPCSHAFYPVVSHIDL